MSLDVDMARVVTETLAKLTVVWDEIGSSQEERRANVDQMAQDVLSVYENYYSKAVLHCNCLKQQIKDQTEYFRGIADELGEHGPELQLPGGSMSTQIEYINERIEVLEQMRAERAVHLEALVEQLRLIQAELGVQLEHTYLSRSDDASTDPLRGAGGGGGGGDADGDGDGGCSAGGDGDGDGGRGKTDVDGSTAHGESLMHNVSLDHTSDFSMQHITEVEECLKRAQAEKHKREKEATDLEGDLAELLAELGCNEESLSLPTTLRLHQSAIEQLRERVSSLFKLRANRQEEIAMLAEKITLLWDRLGVDSAVREAWVLQNNGKITDGVVHACESELDRLQTIHIAHIKQEIAEATMRLHSLWDELSIPQIDRTMPDTSGLNADEEVLERIINHKSSLEKHLAAIRPLMELINEREALHAEKADFEEKASNPTRLLSKKTKRDPGWLLKEEQIRKSFTTKLPKLEAILRKNLLEYQQNHHTAFLYNGEPYLDRMLTQEEKEKRKKEEEKSRKDKEKAQQLEKELLYGSTVATPAVKTPALNSSVVQSSKRKRPALSPISSNIPSLLTPQYSPKKMAHTLNMSLLDSSTRLHFDENENEN